MEIIRCISYVRNATKEELMSTFEYSYPDGLEWDENEQAWKITFNALSNENAWYCEGDDDVMGKLPNAKFKKMYFNEDWSLRKSDADYMNKEEFEKYLDEELKKKELKR